MRARFVFSTFVCLLLGSVLLNLRAENPRTASGEEDNGYSQISIFAKAVQLIRQDYVDGNKTGYRDLITAAMKAERT